MTTGANNAPLGTLPLMVRVRKDAMKLSAAERTRFIEAMSILNNRGAGRFNQFRDMHRQETLEEAHGADGFLPWHRAYLLDLERELQNVDASVTLPYWRFDRPARDVFTRDFLGESNAAGVVQFASTNKLQFWRTDNGTGVLRRLLFSPAASARGDLGPVRTEASTMNDLGTDYGGFIRMEGQPHAAAHRSFAEFLSNADTAPRDPLFFLLHCNVDRLWARWQWLKRRFDPAVPGSFRGSPRPGHRLNDTMWPWNNDRNPPRPNTAPGGTIAPSPVTAAPSPSPAVREMIDYQGKTNAAGWLGFDYDDVPFEP
ncbi:MAG TPA: tyrosinase family protein [Thermoanaerobaculia bacterium]